MRCLRSRVALAVAGLLLAGGSLMSASPTLAAWTDSEYAKGTIAAVTVMPPTGLACTGGLASVTFTWNLPASGPTPTAWQRTWAGGAPTTIAPTPRSAQFFSLLNVGTVFTVRTVVNGWTSAAATATVTSVVLGAVTCAVSTAP